MAPVHQAGKTSRPNLKSATGKTANNNWIIVSIVAAVETPLALPRMPRRAHVRGFGPSACTPGVRRSRTSVPVDGVSGPVAVMDGSGGRWTD